MSPTSATAIVLQLVLLHSLDGRSIMINPTQVTMLVSAPIGQKNKLFVAGAHCMLNMSDGKFVTVSETCDQVVELLKAWRDDRL
jgi:uncharacterized protein YlzI (FlbEa/FlbD family)